MWTERRGNKYLLIERYTDPATGLQKRISVSMDKNTTQSRKVAQEALQRKIDGMKEHHEVAGTLSELFDEYIRFQMASGIKHSTYKRNERQLNACLKIIGDVPLKRLSVAFIRQRLIRSNESTERLNERLVRLRACLNWAADEEILPPMRLRPFPAQPVQERIKDKYLEKAELLAVLEAMTVEQWKLLTEFLALSGLRIGEAQALTLADISDKYIEVNKTYDREQDETTTPKTRTSYRQVYIQPELQSVIDDIIRMNAQSKVVCPLLFHRDGFPIHYDAYRKYFKEVTERTVGRVLTPHALRHTMTSLFAEQGVSLDAISRRLGDTSAVAKRVYLHTTAEQRKKDNEEVALVRIIS